MQLETWAAKWNVPYGAIADLRRQLGVLDATPLSGSTKSEAAVSNAVRLEASRRGNVLWRNNSGAYQDDTGRLIRYGLANDSSALNAVVKSHDLIGIRRLLITPEHVGRYVGQFMSVECKAPTWRYSGTAREIAQQNFAMRVVTMGGWAGFVTREGQLPP